ncbi:DUF7111 family protein [Halococcoides cellulosivorans]|uniref:Uncharacterized protein n=1 Tax=Halococcoides cellulosivorans TaxID=1679096 RepID=A0A2R4X0C1_9EURY|nr:hypothetical protein [Halococcoides cellulosivorans]AWB27226.1 hypothetical protein HARCEL1_05680 [Halococcoides cellulosivorans]
MGHSDDIEADYVETDTERQLRYSRGGQRVTVAQNTEGYAMLAVRAGGEERERYYGFDMALDHAAELLGVEPRELPIPDAAADMGM